ncbi:hypothetical protein [Photobacterium phosphoreum]|uniref:hypothetical protein n=1 Tax=Photobacterium phosphoreum TaxID=659 RepID=UPI0024319A80|nr:hypothetical protein [Photobacterium phosphoreum]
MEITDKFCLESIDEKYQVYALVSKTLNTVFLSTHIKFEGKTITFLREDMKTWRRSPNLKAKIKELSDAKDFYIGLDYQVSCGDEYNSVIASYKNQGYKVLGCPKLIKSNKIL